MRRGTWLTPKRHSLRRGMACVILFMLVAGPTWAQPGGPSSGGGHTVGSTAQADVIVGHPLMGTTASGQAGFGLGLLAGFTFDTMTAVDLAYFRVGWTDQGVVVSWGISGTPYDHAGFRVFRQVHDAAREQISPSLLHGQRTYQFVDPTPPDGRVSYWLAEVARTGAVTWYGPASLELTRERVPQLALLPNWPNPFRASTRIPFQVPQAGRVRITILDPQGRLVAQLLDAQLEAGVYESVWNGVGRDGTRIAAGVFFYRLETEHDRLTRKLVVLP